MSSRLRVHSNHSLCPSIPKFTGPICSVHQDPSRQKWLPFELICAVYLEYIVSIHFVRPYPNLLTLYIQYTKSLAVKKWLPFELIYAVYIVTLNSSPVVTWYESECGEYLDYIVTSNFVRPDPIFLTLYVQYTSRQKVASI